MTGIEESTNAVTRIMGDDGNDPQLSQQELLEMIGTSTGDLTDFGRLRTLGLGGVGEVFAGTDPCLRRSLAVKILRPEFRARRRLVENFIREARVTAQIDHPNVVPVHRLGFSTDAGVFFTMKAIEGRDLRSIIRSLREKKPSAEKFSALTRRLEIFIAVCQGVAFAHSKGIIHCDLKPANIMVGNFGEVMIMDWGLSVYRQEKDSATSGQRIDLDRASGDLSPEESVRDLPAGAVRVSGTPAFMSPEQASGQRTLIDEKSDIYGLGTILYCLLTLENAPVLPDRPTADVLHDVERGRILRPRRRAPFRAIPRELEAITMKALAQCREDRYHSVEDLIEDVRHYLEKYPVLAYQTNWFYKLRKLALRRPLVPLTLLAAVLAGGGVLGINAGQEYMRQEAVFKQVHYSAMQADAYYKLATRTYRNLLRQTSAVPEKEYLRQEIEFNNYTNAALEGIYMQEIRRFLLPSRRKELLPVFCHLVRQQIAFCHLTGNTAVLLTSIRQLQSRWQENMSEILSYDTELALMIRQISRNNGGIILRAPEKVKVMIRRENPDQGAPGKWVSATADTLWNIPSGSYLVRAEFPGGKEVFCPVETEPGRREILDLQTLPEVPEGFVLVRGGVFRTGDVEVRSPLFRHLPAFFIQKHEVTIGDYLKFWHSLKDPVQKKMYRAVYRDAGGLGNFVWAEDGTLYAGFSADMPVFGISGPAAEAYCRYLTAQTGRFHRLPTQLEWEKAARGVDGRRYVWGNIYRSGNAFTANHPAEPHHFAIPAGRYPDDRSVYGAWDMAGNLREMVRNPQDSGNIYRVMGGSFQLGGQQATTYQVGSTNNGVRDAGFRCVIEIPQKAEINSL